MFERERKTVSGRIKVNFENARMFEEEIKRFNKWMTVSAVCQEIGIQAAFAAATMGAATYLTTTTRMAQAGSWVANLGRGQKVIQFAANVGGLSARTEGAIAMTGILSRAAAGVTILLIRRLTGDLGTKKAMNFEGFGSALFLTVLCAWVGSPGAKRPNITPLKKLVEQLPSSLSAQGAVQGIGLVRQGLNAWIKQPDNKDVMEMIKAHRAEFDQQLDALANKQAKEIVDWARNAEGEISRQIERDAQKIDYAAKLPFFARNFDFVGNAEALKEMSINAAQYYAKSEFWIRVGHCLSDLERSVREAKHIGK